MPAPLATTTLRSAGGTVTGGAAVVSTGAAVVSVTSEPSSLMSTLSSSSSKPTLPPAASRIAPRTTATMTRMKPLDAGSGPDGPERRGRWRWAEVMGKL